MEKKNLHMSYGFITGIIMVICQVIFYMSGIAFKPGMQAVGYLVFIPFLIGVIMECVAYSKANDGFVTFGNVFGSGFKTTAIITLVMLAWAIISMFVFPDMKTKAIEMARDKMVQDQKATDEQVEMGINMMQKYWTIFLIGGTIIGDLFWGLLFSLIGGAVAKKKGPRPMTAADNF